VNHLKFLYDAFLPEYYWTEVMECLRKLLLTGFVVFFYEGSALQILLGLVISIIFFGLYSYLQPYLMPSNNTFASFVHFQISFTLILTFGIRMNENLSSEDKSDMKLDNVFLSYLLLISATSVLLLGVIMILSVFLSSSGKDFSFIGSAKSNGGNENDIQKLRGVEK